MLLIQLKIINRLRKELSRLLSKRISNICLNVFIKTFSELRFSGLKSLSPGQFRAAPTHADIIEF